MSWLRRRSRLAAVITALTAIPSASSAQFLTVRPAERAPPPPGETLVDQVVAAVEVEGDERLPLFVLASDVEIELRYELATARTPPPEPLRVQVDATTWRLVLEFVVGERLLEREAMRAGEASLPAARLAQERLYLQSKLAAVGGSDALLRAAGRPPEDFENFVRRRLLVATFLEAHMARTIEPTEAELRAAYQDERFGAFRAESVPFAVARADIREALLRESYPRAIRAYLRSVGSRARIRVWTSASRGAGA